MFVPLHDDTPLRVIRFQWMTGLLIVVNFLIFLYLHEATSPPYELASMLSLGIVPADFTGRAPTWAAGIPEPLTYVTYQFIHGSWFHLITNVLFLWVFADNIEDVFGHWSFLLFYLLCGIGAGIVHTVMMPASDAPLIGASGAVAGVLASYLLLFPRARVWILLFMRLPLRVPAVYVLTGWLLLQLASLVLVTEQDPSVGWWAHLGGFATGLVLTLVLRSRLLVGPAP
jgi:membrane associated rhomboid family serine protease